MKILQIPQLYQVSNHTKKQDLKNNTQKSTLSETTGIPGMYAYRDYNISFGARLFRSPENFYEQEFNEQNMPRSLHKYIYEEGDSAFKRSIPPAQAMKEVFGKIHDAKNLDDVKRMFPDEPLFTNLTSKPNKKAREGLLGMINLVKEDPTYENETLFKNGDNDLGLYILKKIYIEGKSLKEINKDFNKDVNPEFQSYDITSNDYSAFGIKFPNQSFWRSFVPTREDFPYVFIPRKTSENTTETGGDKEYTTRINHKENNSSIEQAPHNRRFKIKEYHKNQITRDIIDSKGDAEAIKKKVIKRFKKDDPEASFIVKYLSPIMTIAADRIHLSEEMRYFAESEKNEGKQQNGASMFERFWKNNPNLLKDYSLAITDTIEYFENVYGAGGMIPMNNEFEEITKMSENQKAIDYITPEFLELLDYSKTIEPTRNERYLEHEKQQALWEEHFNERYGELDKIKKLEEISTPTPITEENQLEILRKTADEFGAKVLELETKDGNIAYVTANMDEVFDNFFKEKTEFFPDRYRRDFINYVKSNPEISDRYKLSVATQEVKDMLDDERIMSDEEFEDETNAIFYSYYTEKPQETMAVEAAMADLVMKYFKSNEEIPISLYCLAPDEYKVLASKEQNVNDKLRKIFLNNRSELNAMYKSYTTNITPTETLKISRTMMNELFKYNPNKSIASNDIQEIILMLKEMANNIKFKKKNINDTLMLMIPNLNFSKAILEKSLNEDQRRTRFEQIMQLFIKDMLSEEEGIQILRELLSREIIEKHKTKLSDEIYKELLVYSYNFDNPIDAKLFESSMDELKKFDKIYKGKR